jgi:hypothetical protein
MQEICLFSSNSQGEFCKLWINLEALRIIASLELYSDLLLQNVYGARI